MTQRSLLYWTLRAESQLYIRNHYGSDFLLRPHFYKNPQWRLWPRCLVKEILSITFDTNNMYFIISYRKRITIKNWCHWLNHDPCRITKLFTLDGFKLILTTWKWCSFNVVDKPSRIACHQNLIHCATKVFCH